MIFDIIVGNGFDFLKGFVCGCGVGFVGYYFFRKDDMKHLREDLKEVRTMLENERARNKSIQELYDKDLEREKQRHQRIEEYFTRALSGGIPK